MRPSTKQFLLASAGGVLGALVTSIVILAFERRDKDIGQLMAVATDRINRQLPMMVDSETQLIGTMGAGRLLQYNYRLLRVASSQTDTNALKAAFQAQTRNGACTAPELRDTFLKRGITVRFAYADSSFRRLFSVDVTPGDCGF